MIIYRHNNNIKKLCLIVHFKNRNNIKVKNIHIIEYLKKKKKNYYNNQQSLMINGRL